MKGVIILLESVSAVGEDIFAIVEEVYWMLAKVAFFYTSGIVNRSRVTKKEESNAGVQIGYDLAVQAIFELAAI